MDFGDDRCVVDFGVDRVLGLCDRAVGLSFAVVVANLRRGLSTLRIGDGVSLVGVVNRDAVGDRFNPAATLRMCSTRRVGLLI